jgi:hypothetical protein
MRRLLSLLLVLLAAPASAQWVEGTRIGVNADNSKAPLALYIGGNYDAWRDEHAIPRPMAPDQWHTVTLSNIPSDSIAVFLSGLMVITHPLTPVICNLTATFRAPGSTLHPGNYQIQVAATRTLDGPRSTVATWVPVKHQQFEFFYTMTPGCPSLINLSLQAYLR